MKSNVLVCLLFCLLIFRIDAWRAKVEITERVVAALPISIEPKGFAMRNVRTGLWSALISDSCGVTAIRITDETAKRIKEEDLTFFETVKRSRSNTVRGGRPVIYEDWYKMPESFARSIGDSMIMAIFSCAGRSGIPSRQIIEGLKGGNAYVSNKGDSDFYVLPDQKLFVHAFLD